MSETLDKKQKILCINKLGQEKMVSIEAIKNKWVVDYWPKQELESSALNSLSPEAKANEPEQEKTPSGKTELEAFVNNTSDLDVLEGLKLKRKLPWQTAIIDKRIAEIKQPVSSSNNLKDLSNGK